MYSVNTATHSWHLKMRTRFTKKVMNEKVSKDILERYEIGQRIFVELAIGRMTEGQLCVWDKMTKKKLKTFCKDQRGAWSVAKTHRTLKKSTTA